MSDADGVILVVRTAGALAASVRAVQAVQPQAQVVGLAISTPDTIGSTLAGMVLTDGVIFTSENGVVSGPPVGLDGPVWCVGETTAAAARAAGWPVHGVGVGDGLVMAHAMVAAAARGTWWHWCSAEAGQDWYAVLRQAGHRVVRQEVYRMRYAEDLPEAVQAALAKRWQKTLLLSAESARCLRHLLEKAKIEPKGALYALSDSVAAAAPGFDRVHVAASPNWAALLDRLADAADHNNKTT